MAFPPVRGGGGEAGGTRAGGPGASQSRGGREERGGARGPFKAAPSRDFTRWRRAAVGRGGDGGGIGAEVISRPFSVWGGGVGMGSPLPSADRRGPPRGRAPPLSAVLRPGDWRAPPREQGALRGLHLRQPVN